MLVSLLSCEERAIHGAFWIMRIHKLFLDRRVSAVHAEILGIQRYLAYKGLILYMNSQTSDLSGQSPQHRYSL